MQTTTKLTFHAELLGGRADGELVELASLLPRLAVYRNGAGPVATEPGAVPPGAGYVRVGDYELVGPAGPEMPVYVPAS